MVRWRHVFRWCVRFDDVHVLEWQVMVDGILIGLAVIGLLLAYVGLKG